MKTILKKVLITTKKQFELVNVTDHVSQAISQSGVLDGVAVLFCPHTTAGLRLNHDESLLSQDIMKAIYRLIPIDMSYSHDLFEIRQNVAPNERSNGHAHVKAFMLGSSESLIVDKGKPLLGAKQSVFFVELDGGRDRELYLKIIGE